jgi:DNA-binding transcriptional MerR regulator
VQNNSGNVNGLDTEWIKLILEAKNAGLSIEEIREFLHQCNKGATV